jgi:hypothetical protein
MVACGTSGLLGGLRVFAPFALPVDDNSLIPAVAFALVVRGFRVVVFLTSVFLVGFLAMIFSP